MNFINTNYTKDNKLLNSLFLNLKRFPKTKKKLGLYPIVDSILWIRRMLDAGVSTIQLRIKNKKDIEIRNDIQKAIVLAKEYNACLFINDYFKYAVEYGAYGVHLGQEDLKITDLQMIYSSGLRLGISTHNRYELDIAKLLQPSYIAIGHIFPTKTKKMMSFPQGLKTLKYMVKLTYNYSTVAIGGISLKNVSDVLTSGVGGIALISAITQSNNWMFTVKKLLDLVEFNKN